MSHSNVHLIIAGLAAGTYLVRVLPFAWRFTDRLPPWGRRFLGAIPPAALGALLLPGIFQAVENRPEVGTAVAAVALVVGYFSRSILAPVSAGILTAYLLLILW